MFLKFGSALISAFLCVPSAKTSAPSAVNETLKAFTAEKKQRHRRGRREFQNRALPKILTVSP